jgi:hypothetical protein
MQCECNRRLKNIQASRRSTIFCLDPERKTVGFSPEAVTPKSERHPKFCQLIPFISLHWKQSQNTKATSPVAFAVSMTALSPTAFQRAAQSPGSGRLS